MPDYSSWLTKQQAADAIGCSTKLVEQFAKERKIQSAKWKRPQTGARIAVYHPADVKRLRKARNPGAEPFVMPPGPPDTGALSENLSQSSQTPYPAGGEAQLPALAGALSAPMAQSAGVLAKALEAAAAQFAALASQNSEKRGAWPVPLFLTTQEAVQYTGLNARYLDGLVKSGRLSRIEKGVRGHRYRKADLDRLGESAQASSAGASR